jgi:hypothetical protein
VEQIPWMLVIGTHKGLFEKYAGKTVRKLEVFDWRNGDLSISGDA